MTNTIILAAGKGTRMESEIPKVLNLILGKPIIHYLLNSILESEISKKPIIVVSPDNYEQIKTGLKNYSCYFAIQKQQLGTGNAVASIFESDIELEENSMVLMGDHACYSADTLQKLNTSYNNSKSPLTMATTIVPEFKNTFECLYGFGRVIRNNVSEIIAIVEKIDTTKQEKEIKEINPGLYVFNTQWLKQNIKKVKMNERKKEYYLTDIIAVAVEQKIKINSIVIPPEQCLGINTPQDKQRVENLLKAT